MNIAKVILISTFGGYATSYALGNIWFYSVQEHIFKPIDQSVLQNPDHNFANTFGMYFVGWKNLLFNIYGYTDYEAEVEKEKLEAEIKAKGYKVDKF